MSRDDSTMRSSFTTLWIRSLDKPELHVLIDDVKLGDSDATARATEFVAAESFGMWHNRGRAKLCRYFKNHPPGDEECNRMVDAIVNRLIAGRFSEQFKDQLAMAIRIAPDRMSNAANVASNSDRGYIRRYAEWIRHALNTSTTFPTGAQPAHSQDAAAARFRD